MSADKASVVMPSRGSHAGGTLQGVTPKVADDRKTVGHVMRCRVGFNNGLPGHKTASMLPLPGPKRLPSYRILSLSTSSLPYIEGHIPAFFLSPSLSQVVVSYRRPQSKPMMCSTVEYMPRTLASK